MRPADLARLAVTAALIFPAAAEAQTYPTRAIRIITAVPGSGTDLISRVIAQGLTSNLGQPAVVDNRGIVGIEVAAKASPDGYTLLLYTSPLWLMPIFRTDASWDVLRDFKPIMAPTVTPNILVVLPSLPVSSVHELIAYAKAKPGALNYGSGSTGSTAHIAGELFKSMNGVDLVRINFKGTGVALTAMLAGEVQVIFPAAGTATPFIKSGKVRALAVSSAQPSALAPGLPTIAASGVPGYESSSMSGIFAPAHTPAPIVNRLYAEMVRLLTVPEVKERLFSTGLDVVTLPSDEFARFIRSDVSRVTKMVKNAKLRE